MKSELKQWGEWLLVMKGLNQITIKGYQASIRPILKKFKTTSLKKEQIHKYIVNMYKLNYSYSHIVNTSLAIEWWFKWKGEELKLGRPKKPRTIIKNTMTESEVTKIIATTDNIKEKAIMSVLAYSGIRNQELCNLRVCDVSLGDNHIRIFKGKGKKDRAICISGDCVRILIDYLMKFPRLEDDYLFTTYQGNQYTGFSLRKLVKKLSRKAKINKRVYPHLFRHSLATNLLNRGANLVTVQNQLGHVFLESTTIYAKSRPQRIQSEYQIYCPSYL